MFTGEGQYEYNLDALTEIKVTESYMGLDKEWTECQRESIDNCTTKHYIETVLSKCGCMPLSIGIADKVFVLF